MKYIEIDNSGYFIYDAPFTDGTESNIAPAIASDNTKPDGMRKPRYVNGSWIDEEADLLAADLSAQAVVVRRNEITKRLQEIDMDSVRALRAQKIGRGSQPDIDKLTALEDEAELLRTELGGL